ncbi:NAD-dependent epimerase/dehydratase family protein [Nocardia seriolae]|uniref:NAD-dependent epimerase/dehydratase family protein n=1 Tax=Nocardia seriolae TaxID=37332 RepID=UPI0004B8FFEC|nr:NAD-dependent epimerase/dehydratase family protein [Nocardia seriolae]MTJ64196.1 NAD-dependent epimerase/dehydratase family protein [Nocardia seriolae]MTJ73165.1 NAD-dependent epimerase/dehydratase family protein [Nocardia seriolae]MTJ89190.1 NAD-dependent epimerase/dehydratase family protein [Nocardia seriolae]MTK33168.1 NAD-dependent epimerase/dehydratase family protein [Nocardia seriolae]MTK42124.1 NAD-dependent epimerase/dehydratase family protein [Nocardia seriolae]
MKVLVTGASGFLGGALVRRLVRDTDHEVSILVRRTSNLRDLARVIDRVRRVEGDLSDPESLDHAVTGVDIVFHSAARVDERGTRARFWAENTVATSRLLAAAQTAGARRFVFISSPSALMDRDGGDQIDIDESVPYPSRYLNFYCETKAAAERLVLKANTPEFTTVALRPRAIWGAGDRSGPIVRLLERAAAGTLPDLSAGREVYASLCHVDNIVEASLLAAASENVGGKAYFIADAEKTNVWRFLGDVAEDLGCARPSRRLDPRAVGLIVSAIENLRRIPYLAEHWTPPLSRYSVAVMTRSGPYDTSAATRDFGYHPVMDRDTGMAELKSWLRSTGVIAGSTH